MTVRRPFRLAVPLVLAALLAGCFTPAEEARLPDPFASESSRQVRAVVTPDAPAVTLIPITNDTRSIQVTVDLTNPEVENGTAAFTNATVTIDLAGQRLLERTYTLEPESVVSPGQRAVEQGQPVNAVPVVARASVPAPEDRPFGGATGFATMTLTTDAGEVVATGSVSTSTT